jgi:hypothetical protein
MRLALGVALSGAVWLGAAQVWAEDVPAGSSASGGEAVAARPGGDSAGSPAAPAERMLGQHDMTGEVTSVGQDGWVDLKTDKGALKLYFPPESLSGVKDGDTITVRLGFSKS